LLLVAFASLQLVSIRHFLVGTDRHLKISSWQAHLFHLRYIFIIFYPTMHCIFVVGLSLTTVFGLTSWCEAWAPPVSHVAHHRPAFWLHSASLDDDDETSFGSHTPHHHHHHHPTSGNNSKTKTTTIGATSAGLWWLALTTAASANDSPDWGLLEGRIGSLLHPTAMGSLFLFSLSTAVLGVQWRRQRTLGTILKDKQQALLATSAAAADTSTVVESSVSPSTAIVNPVVKEMQQEIDALQQERKDLAAAAPRDRHFSQGALLAFLGTAFAIEVSYSTQAEWKKTTHSIIPDIFSLA
jgi:hypothetical protein